jgi:ArsR family metal-binding transcriptional regulator
MDNLKSDDFKDILPLLRRTFSQFQKSEKEQMLTLAKRGQVIENQNLVDIEMDLDRAESVLPTVHILLGTA